MIAKGLIDSSYKIVNNINWKLNVENTPKDTLLSNDVEQVTPADIHLSTKHESIALELLDTSSPIDNNIFLCDLKD